MRIGASIVGDFRKVLAAEVKAGERAAMTAIRAETEQVKAELRRQVLLLPQVKLAKRLDVRGAAERGLRRLPGRFVAAWERESGRAG